MHILGNLTGLIVEGAFANEANRQKSELAAKKRAGNTVSLEESWESDAAHVDFSHIDKANDMARIAIEKTQKVLDGEQ